MLDDYEEDVFYYEYVKILPKLHSMMQNEDHILEIDSELDDEEDEPVENKKESNESEETGQRHGKGNETEMS
jgi:hypothetical protein